MVYDYSLEATIYISLPEKKFEEAEKIHPSNTKGEIVLQFLGELESIFEEDFLEELEAVEDVVEYVITKREVATKARK